MAEQKPPQKPKKQKPLVERLKDLVDEFLGDLESVLNPPRPVRVPAGGRRPR